MLGTWAARSSRFSRHQTPRRTAVQHGAELLLLPEEEDEGCTLPPLHAVHGAGLSRDGEDGRLGRKDRERHRENRAVRQRERESACV